MKKHASKQRRSGLKRKLVRVFLIQTLAITIATIAGVFLTAKVVERILLKEALHGEAQYFWDHYTQNADFPLPDTANLTTYMADSDQLETLPAPIRQMSSDYERVDFANGRRPLVLVSENNGKHLYLVFEAVEVSRLALYFGIAPLTIVLLVIYTLMGFGFIMSGRAISPLVQLASILESADIKQLSNTRAALADLNADKDSETQSLITAFDTFSNRLESFIERERLFTRNASHELRTPLAVIKGNISLLEESGIVNQDLQSLNTIKRTLGDMETLLDTLLWLARDAAQPAQIEEIMVNDYLVQLLEEYQSLLKDSEVNLSLQAQGVLSLKAPRNAVQIILRNLVQNAVHYTQKGEITVLLDERSVTVKDTGVGIPSEKLETIFQPFYRLEESSIKGYGLGLSIVKQVCDRMGWQVKVASEHGKGTEVSIDFIR